jgi:8-oxo-dGTP pyrophosphatase MutT (NUDIX family)
MTSSQGYKGAGIILVRPGAEGPHFLLLRGATCDIWGFPKGHREEEDGGEALRTAVRETREETGLLPEIDYTLVSRTMRFGKYLYWLGVVRADATVSVRLAPREHSAAGWFTLNEITQMTTNHGVRAWLKSSASFMRFLQQVASAQMNEPMPATHSFAAARIAS